MLNYLIREFLALLFVVGMPVYNFRAVLEGVGIGLVDWDGCLTSERGEWHGVLIAETLNRCPSFACYGKTTRDESLAAYLGPGHGIPWDDLILQNLVRPHLARADVADEKVVEKIRQEIWSELPRVAQQFRDGEIYADVRVRPNPGAREFLYACRRDGIPVIVITMTPGCLAEALAVRSRLKSLVDEIHGCEEFTQYPEGKSNPELWLKEATKRGFTPAQTMIVEDGKPGTIGALRAEIHRLVLLKAERLELIRELTKCSIFVALKTGNFFTLLDAKEDDLMQF